jgi:hypothetical protein
MSDEAKKENGPSASLSRAWVKAAKKNTNKKRRTDGKRFVNAELARMAA